jgi:hypothetical protein
MINYGVNSFHSGGSLPSALKQSTVKILANSKCKQSYPQIVNTMLCAAAPATDTCQVFDSFDSNEILIAISLFL